MKKIKSYHVNVTTRLIVSVPEDADILDVVNNMEYSFITSDEDCKVLDEEITDIEVVNS